MALCARVVQRGATRRHACDTSAFIADRGRCDQPILGRALLLTDRIGVHVRCSEAEAHTGAGRTETKRRTTARVCAAILPQTAYRTARSKLRAANAHGNEPRSMTHVQAWSGSITTSPVDRTRYSLGQASSKLMRSGGNLYSLPFAGENVNPYFASAAASVATY